MKKTKELRKLFRQSILCRPRRNVADKNIVYYNLNIEHWKGSPYVKLEATKTRTEKASNKKIRNQRSMKNVIDTPYLRQQQDWKFTNKHGAVS